MIVEFIKNCPWTLNNRLNRFRKCEVREIPDSDALSMIENGYAKPHIDKIEEVANPEEELEEEVSDTSHGYYINTLSLQELKQFCKDKNISLKSASERTKPTIIKAIFEFEKEHGQIAWSKNE